MKKQMLMLGMLLSVAGGLQARRVDLTTANMSRGEGLDKQVMTDEKKKLPDFLQTLKEKEKQTWEAYKKAWQKNDKLVKLYKQAIKARRAYHSAYINHMDKLAAEESPHNYGYENLMTAEPDNNYYPQGEAHAARAVDLSVGEQNHMQDEGSDMMNE